eukprot:m.17330 g.17330  ORF g.17330 m.17330 type:complete len:244 (+) comp5987_c0_seq2:86-817(+)
MAPGAINVAKLAFVTLLTSSQGGNYGMYVRQVENWVNQLNFHGIPKNHIVLLISDDVDGETKDKLKALNTVVKEVPLYSVHGRGVHHRYVNTPTKIHMWTLTEWDRIAYFDSDMMFMQNPMKCVLKCPKTADVCGVSDPVGTWPVPNPEYFNSGALITKPSMEVYKKLKDMVDGGGHVGTFGDQELFNTLWQRSYTKLPRDCNFLHPKEDLKDLNTVIAIHEKLDALDYLLPKDHKLREVMKF